MKILLSAYACEPMKGSEPEAGIRTLLAAASRHDVWVLTRDNNVAALEDYLGSDSRKQRITIVGMDLHEQLQRIKRRHSAGLQMYYGLWQRNAAKQALQLHSEIGFDLAHHVTFAAYWKRAGVAALPCPLVWGPVGGGLTAPPALWPYLGPLGIAEELARITVRPLMARMPSVRQAARRADVVLLQNKETARRLKTTTQRIIAPNALGVQLPPVEAAQEPGRKIVVVGNLIPLKAVSLGLAAVSHLSVHCRVLIIGDGPDRARLEKVVRHRGLSESVRVTGAVSRAEVLRQVASADVLLHPAVHEEAGMAVAEALALGTPVVCLDQGGPPELLRRWPDTPSRAVQPTTRTGTARQLASAIEEVFAEPLPLERRPRQPTPSYESIVNRAYEIAVQGVPTSRNQADEGCRG